MLQAVLEQPRKVSIRDVEKPVPGPGQILIKIKEIGVCGSDIHAYYGKHPYISCPIVQGHEFSGQVAEVGIGVRAIRPGSDVTVMPQVVCGTCYPCRHGNRHICNSLKVIGCQVDGAAQEYFAVDARLALQLPRGMSYDLGAMIEPAAVGAHALSRLGMVKGMNILVLGAGPIGNLAAQTARGLGARSVMITDISDFRLDIARRCGIGECVNPLKASLDEAILRHFGGDRADAILECVGAQATVEQAITLSRKGTDIVVVGVFGQKPSIDVGLVQDKELRLIGTLMYREPDYRTAIRLIQSRAVDPTPLITHRFAFRDYSGAYLHIERNKDSTMKVLIDMEK
jgi:L-iditol 2-dehydrogenase